MTSPKYNFLIKRLFRHAERHLSINLFNLNVHNITVKSNAKKKDMEEIAKNGLSYILLHNMELSMTEWFKRHSDTLIILGFILGGLHWGDSKFEKVDEKINAHFEKIESKIERVDEKIVRIEQKINFTEKEIDLIHSRFNDRFSILETEMSIFKTILLLKNIMPPELAKHNEGEK